MATYQKLTKRIRAQKQDDFEELSDLSSEASDKQEDRGSHNVGTGASRESTYIGEGESDDQNESDIENSISSERSDEVTVESGRAAQLHPAAHISFGALASAQASLDRKRKRPELPAGTSHDLEKAFKRSPSPFHEANERRAGAKKHKTNAAPTGRASKHAPIEQSSKKAVSRKRSVVPMLSFSARDPRFSSLSGRAPDASKLEQNYGFLDDYRRSELAELREDLLAAKDSETKVDLKRKVRAMEDREKARKRAEAERLVRSEHRRKERGRVKEGKQPFYLKNSEVKRQLLEKRYEELGAKGTEKVMERRRRKQAAKERKEMPWARRGAER